MLYWIGVARTYSSPREGRRAHERAYDLFEAQPDPDKRGLLFACSGAMDSILYELDDFSLLDRWIEVMNRMLRQNADLLSGLLEARIACSLFTSMVLRQPHHPEIEYWAERAYRASSAQTDLSARATVEPRIALGIVYAGHFPKAWTIIEGVREIVRRHEVPTHALVMLRLVEASYFMLKGQRDACYEAVRSGIELGRSEGFEIFTRQLLEYGAGGALMAGDEDSAEAFLRALDQLPGVPARFDSCLHHLFSTWLALRRNDDVLAYQQQKLALRAAIDVGCPVFEAVCRIASAQVHYVVGEVRQAWSQLQQVYDIARRIQNRLLEYTGLLCYAHIALDSRRRPRSGMRALRLALALGKPRNFICFPLWEPRMLSQLCSIALECGIETAYVRRLIDERGLKLDSSASGLLDWPWPLHVHTLGRFELVRAGEPIRSKGKAQRRPLELLKLIVACGGRNVSEARITETLWPHVDGDSAHRSFTTTLHRLRKLLNVEGSIQLSGGKVSIDSQLVWVDTWAFEQICTRASHLIRGQGAETGSRDEDLLIAAKKMQALYAGPFLESDCDEGWVLSIRERLRQRYGRLVVELARCAKALGRAEDTIELVERAAETDPANEAIWRCLMETYAEAGRRAEAVATFDRCKAMLARHLQSAPSTETAAMHERILAQG